MWQPHSHTQSHNFIEAEEVESERARERGGEVERGRERERKEIWSERASEAKTGRESVAERRKIETNQDGGREKRETRHLRRAHGSKSHLANVPHVMCVLLARRPMGQGGDNGQQRLRHWLWHGLRHWLWHALWHGLRRNLGVGWYSRPAIVQYRHHGWGGSLVKARRRRKHHRHVLWQRWR